MVLGPGGVVIGSAGFNSGLNHDTYLALRATNSGTFTVRVSSFFAGGSGTYGLRFGQPPGGFIVPAGDEGGTLTNGAVAPGDIALGDFDMWSFTATNGDSIVLRVGTSGFTPYMVLFGPNGAVLETAGFNSGANHDTFMTLRATNSGTFTVVVTSYYYDHNGSASGTYNLTLAQSPVSFVVSPGDQGGALVNGSVNGGTIGLGELDMWSFAATNGQSIVLRVGTTNFTPYLLLYGPNGALIGFEGTASSLNHDAYLTLRATNSGNFTVVLSSYYYDHQASASGTYNLTLALSPDAFVVSPGDQGGPLSNGAVHAGTINLGELDMWSFTATNGNNIFLRVGTSGFTPFLNLYGPNGALIASESTASSANHDAYVSLVATNSGTFTVVLSSYYYDHTTSAAGTYNLTLAQMPGSFVVSPGDEGGALTNGAVHPGAIGLGELDMWSFTATNGNRIFLRVGTAGFTPFLHLYGPNGALIASEATGSSANHDAYVSLVATNSGTFTVVLSSYYYDHSASASGTYNLTLAQMPAAFVVSPGDEGGALTNGAINAGTLALGELDMWSFTANAGEGVMLRVGTTGFTPWLTLYGPNGALIGSAATASSANRDTYLNVQTTNSGTFTVVLSSYYYDHSAGASGTYGLSLAHAPGDLFISPGDEGGTLTNGLVNVCTNAIGDLDAWSFYGTPGDSNVFRIVTTNFTPWLRLYGPTGALLRDVFIASTLNRSNGFNFVITNAGYYTLVVGATYLDQSGTYSLKQSRVPPDLIVPSTVFISEGTTLNVPVSAQDPDIPDKLLTFTKISGPSGSVLTPNGNTNATITWPTDEITGPVTNTFVLSVTDNVGGRDFIRTNSFIVVVNEINEPPVLTVPSQQVINELTSLNVSASATDPDVPLNPLTYSLVSPPAGMTIDPNTGAIAWTPTEAQGSNSYSITVVVTDTNPPAVNTTSISVTNFFTVIVREVNVPPQLTVPGNQTINELTALNVSASATDADLPLNQLTYSLLSPPGGMTINPTTGAISWTPTEAQGPFTNLVMVVVADSNPTAVNAVQLSATNSFTVTVREVNVAPQLTVPTNQAINELTALNVSASATDSDVPANPLTYSLVSPPSGMTINPNTGAIAWTPTEAQGPVTNVITVVVTDTNSAALANQQFSVTNTFTVTVREVNTAPQLTVPANQALDELTALNVSASATDSDVPTNSLTFTLNSPPAGMTINPVTGAIAWTPTEAQGPFTNVIAVVVTDANASAGNALSVTNTFSVTVREVNTAPQLTVPTNQTIDELTALNVSASAADSDVPANPLVYSLVSPPAGMTINPNSGAIAWTPTETQGPFTNLISVVVADTNAAAQNNQTLRVTNTFTVTVREVNVPPVLQAITNQSVHFGILLSVQALASDSDVPANTLAFSLVQYPSGMTIGAASGQVSWTPAPAQVGTHPVQVRVADNGSPSLSATQTFNVTVTGEGSRMVINRVSGSNLKQLDITGDVGLRYELQISTNLINWSKLTDFTLDTSPYPYIDPASATQPTRFYRLLQLP